MRFSTVLKRTIIALVLVCAICLCYKVGVKKYKQNKLNNLTNIVFMGKAGSGKGTYGAKLAKEYNLYHMSSGQVLRDYIKNNDNENSKKISSIINEGKLIPDEITFEVLKEDIDKKVLCLRCKYKGIIFDGFPRNANSVRFFNDNNIKVYKAVNIDITDEEAIKRIKNRNEGRKDDQDINAIKQRLDIYHKQTKDVVVALTTELNNPNIVEVVNGMGTKDEVYESVKNVLNLK